MRNIEITIGNNKYEYEFGVPYEKIAKDFQEQYDEQIVLVSVNGKLKELHKLASDDCTVEFVTTDNKIGAETYKRSCCFLLVKALHDVVGDVANKNHIVIQYSIGKGLYCKLSESIEVTDQFLRTVRARMDELVSQNVAIWKNSIAVDEAIKMFSEAGMNDKVKLFKFRRASKVNVYTLGDYKDYYYGYMVPSTGYLKYYDLIAYDEGFILQLPSKRNPKVVPEFRAQDKIAATMKKTNDWGVDIGLQTVGDLNERICREGGAQDIVLVQESLMESKIADIARDIADKSDKKFVMIAGPSSSGKTSFSHRLSIQLRALGLNPHPIALDNYFKNREDTPKDENGNYNFECLEAIDVEGFNNDMVALLNGETVELPTFNFKTGLREYKGDYMRLEENDVLVIEGIHGLNEKMSYALPSESKYKVYISALTALSVDEHNRIATTDVRLIRRMVRDNRTRGTSASGTLAMWESVRRGEEEYIFPYQENADAIFNSALIYELAVLKQFAEPLLFGISKDDPNYQEAKRLLKFLDYFLGVTSEGLPNNSILREFVGGSVFNV